MAPNEDVVRQLEAIGAPDDVIEAARARAVPDREPDVIEIWRDCADAWTFFLSLHGQWAFVSGMTTRRTGLPSERVLAHMELQRIPRRRRRKLFEDVNTMERAVLQVDREAAQKRAAAQDGAK